MKRMRTLIVGAALLSTGCASLTPEPSEREINAEAAKAYRQVVAKAKLSQNRVWTEMVQRVSQRIAAASGENFQWEYVLIDSPEVNAWCMPGGKIAVYTGIMPVLKTEGALAAVLGHEVAHATLRHGKERYARAIKENLAGALIGGAVIAGGQLFCQTQACRDALAIGGAAAGIALTFFDRKFSRSQESSADRSGQIFMARAGYDPSEAIQVWVRMAQAKKGAAPPEFMSTHPSDERRRGQLQEWLPEAQQVYESAPAKYGIGGRI